MSPSSAETDAGKELDALAEKFEKLKKFSDEKVRALAKAQSDVRALEGKLEDITRDLAAANDAARAERRREEEEDAAAKATSGGKGAAARTPTSATAAPRLGRPACRAAATTAAARTPTSATAAQRYGRPACRAASAGAASAGREPRRSATAALRQCPAPPAQRAALGDQGGPPHLKFILAPP